MDFSFLKKTILFHNLKDQELKEAFSYLKTRVASFEKKETIFHAGFPTSELGVVLSGSVHIENYDLWGNRTILGHVEPGGIFAESYALFPKEAMMVDVIANEPAKILFIDIYNFISKEYPAYSSYRKIYQNLLIAASRKNLELSSRIFHTSSKTIRGRISSYLSGQSIRCHSTEFSIPFNRQQLADYLSVDRSALSKELGKMREEELIRFRKNHFEIIEL